MMVWAFEFPSIFGFILFVWAAVGLVVPRHWFLRSSVVLVVLMALAIVVEYIYSVPDSRFGDKVRLNHKVCRELTTTILELPAARPETKGQWANDLFPWAQVPHLSSNCLCLQFSQFY